MRKEGAARAVEVGDFNIQQPIFNIQCPRLAKRQAWEQPGRHGGRPSRIEPRRTSADSVRGTRLERRLVRREGGFSGSGFTVQRLGAEWGGAAGFNYELRELREKQPVPLAKIAKAAKLGMGRRARHPRPAGIRPRRTAADSVRGPARTLSVPSVPSGVDSSCDARFSGSRLGEQPGGLQADSLIPKGGIQSRIKDENLKWGSPEVGI
jgi:hypothetical protein